MSVKSMNSIGSNSIATTSKLMAHNVNVSSAPISISTALTTADTDSFIPPPEAPVFYPTAEEFACGPLEYIAKIRAEAEPHGICKIIPPNTFQPPFAVAVEEFRFTPRIQRLNELEATTRIKLNFIEQIVKFWDLQGSPFRDKIRGASFKIPNLERRSLDLYQLHKIVKEEGGFETCTRERKWSRVASRMGYGNNAPNKGTIASLLRQHYERILFPYDVFQSGATIGPDVDDKIPYSSDEDGDTDNKDSCDSKSSLSSNEKQTTPEKRILRRQQAVRHRYQPVLSPTSQNQSKELRKLQFYGAGPKMPGVQSEQQNVNKEPQNKICLQCNESNPTPMLLTCDNCDNTYHTHCLIPPLNDWPKGVWHCHRCLALLVSSHPQPYTHEFGFAQSQKNYTLSEFGEMADQFKADYFHCPPHSVPLSLVEKEFWRLVSAIEESVAVEYGADLHTNDYGSGFPSKYTKNLLPSDAEYVTSSWNLNNLPTLEGSVFRHINANISGMIIPWMYVGMCFATFCWHNEDHWTYSINYLHWGEPKTWYGVPGEHAETFERAMKRAAPELFKSQPDLLHQLVTICNPNILMQDGVPVYRTNQHAGEFVVTFPRAYHTGFNQGLNFAEAVNFAPSDWLPIGRVCITHYAMLHRFPVFSHDELICKMANEPNKLEITLAVATYRDMLRMVECEKSSRLALLEWGVTHAERENFELLPDDERQCDYCKTTCFLSALACHCDQAKIVCINHKENLCNTCLPSQHTLRYRYTLDELPIMLHHLRKRAEKFDEWASKVQKLLNDENDDNSSTNDKLPFLKELRDLLNDAITNRYPTNSEIYEQLQLIVTESSKCSRAARDLLKQQETYRKQQQLCNDMVQQSPAKRTLRSTAVKSSNYIKNENVNTKLTLEEINLFYEEILTLRCEIPESGLLKELVDRCNAIASSIMKVLETSEINEQLLNVTDLDNILSDAQSIAVVDFGPQLECFKHKQEELKWLDECNQILITNRDVKINDVKLLELANIRNLIESGMKLAASTENINSKLADLQQMLDEANKWIDKTKLIFYIKEEGENETEANTRKPTVEALESLLVDVQNSPNLSRIQLSPHSDRIRDCYQKARDWISRVNVMFGNDNPKQSKKVTLSNANAGEAPMIQAVEELVSSAIGIECQLEHLPNLNSTISAARAWKERLSRTFCKKNSLYCLVNIITPRIQTHSDNLFSTRALYQFLKRSLIASTKERKGNPNAQQTQKVQKSIFETQLNGNYSRACIVALYKIFEEQEIAHIKNLRIANKDKQNYLLSKISDLVTDATDSVLDEQPNVVPFVKFCICGKDANEWMIQCQLCWDWFHNSCVQNYSSTIARKKQASQQSPEESLHIQQHFICILCCRGRRPRLENVLSLLCSLQKLPIRILEGELLQRVAERAIAWQDKARNALNARTDLASGYARVLRIEKTPSMQSSQTNQTNLYSPTKLEKMSDTQHISEEVLVKDRNIEDITTEESTAEALLQLRASHHEKNLSNEANTELSKSQHFSQNITYVSSQESNVSSDSSPLKHKRKSPLILRVETASQPLIDLNEESKQILEDLLLEGSCLEVTLDELPHLWHIWQYANANKRTVIFYNNKDESMPTISQKRKLPAANTEQEIPKRKKNNMKEKSPKKSTTKEKKVGKKSRSDDDEVCLMKDSCLRPNAAEVNWVFCDGACNGWYHQLCIGIDSPEKIASLEQFFCIKCRKQTTN